MSKPTLISIHGIRTKGAWQDSFDNLVNQEFDHKPFKFGYYDVLRFLNPVSNKRMVEKFYAFYSEIIKNAATRPSIIAHSFGTFIVAYCLLKRQEIRFDKLILCGSILPKNFDWNTLLARNQVNQVRNEYSKLDIWARTVKRFVRKTGSSGYSGSSYKRATFFEKRFDYDHSDYFAQNHMKEHWIPFLKQDCPVFIVRNGADTILDDYFKALKDMRSIDSACYGSVKNHEEVALEEGLSSKWISINNDIYTYVVEEKTGKTKGYINAMPLTDVTFDKVINGEIKDNEIKEDDIVPYLNNQNIKIYFLSIATDLDVRQFKGGLINTVAERLMAGFFKKLIDYWENDNIKITEFAAIAWTSQGKRICELLGMQQVRKDEYGHSVFWVDTCNFITHKKFFIQGMDNLIKAYQKK